MNIYKSHPWHGIDPGPKLPDEIVAFIEIVPADTVKYEIDKTTGYLSIDRPQKFSNVVPCLYGFIPRTYCGDKVAEHDAVKSGIKIAKADGDALDICVLTERTIFHGDILLRAIPIGGIRLLDKGEADDKIIAVLKDDEVYAEWSDIEHMPETLITRLKHYFLTYKNIPGTEPKIIEVIGVFGKQDAHELIRRSVVDYQTNFSQY